VVDLFQIGVFLFEEGDALSEKDIFSFQGGNEAPEKYFSKW